MTEGAAEEDGEEVVEADNDGVGPATVNGEETEDGAGGGRGEEEETGGTAGLADEAAREVSACC